MLESLSHAENSFVTLTYRDEVLPPGGTLVPAHYQKWLYRLRNVAPNPLRFFLVGEYGDQTHRPHFHAAIFGFPGCMYNHPDAHSRSKCGCYSCSTIRKTWECKKAKTGGRTDCAYLTPDSAQYLAGYVVKKLTSKTDPRLGGRHPEFARMSLKPGIGALSVPHIADVLTSDPGCNSIVGTGDVPQSLKQGTKSLPLGRYLRSKLRAQLGFKETSTPQEMLLQLQQENSEILAAELQKTENKNKSISKILVDLNKQKVLNLETRLKIFSKKGSL